MKNFTRSKDTEMKNIKFGIEIETHIPAASPVSVGRYHAGTPCNLLPDFNCAEWKCERDGSIDYPAGRQSAEFVSPILSGTEGIRNVVKAVAAIKALDAKVNSSCGIHVTVEWKGDQAALARLIHLVANFEGAFYGSTGTKNRENGSFCKKVKGYGDAAAVQARASWDRYHILNLTHLTSSSGKRIEFRVFSSSLNAAKIVGWIMMCLAVVETALDGRIRPFDHHAPETTVQALKRFFATMKWVSKNRDAARGNVYPNGEAEGLPSRRFVRSELLRMAEKYDAAQ